MLDEQDINESFTILRKTIMVMAFSFIESVPCLAELLMQCLYD